MSESNRPELSPRQRDALIEVEAFQGATGRPPTRAELGKAIRMTHLDSDLWVVDVPKASAGDSCALLPFGSDRNETQHCVRSGR